MSDKDARSTSSCLHSLDTNKFWFLPSITLDHCGKGRERGERRAHIDTEWLAGKTYRGHTRIDLTQEKKQMKYRVWLDARELCVPCGSLYRLLLIWLVMVCRVWGNTKTLRILQHKVSQMPKPHSRPVSVTLMQTLFSFPLLRSLSSYGCQETGKETKREGKTERCFAFFKTEVLPELDGWLAILGLYISIWDTGRKTCHFHHHYFDERLKLTLHAELKETVLQLVTSLRFSWTRGLLLQENERFSEALRYYKLAIGSRPTLACK